MNGNFHFTPLEEEARGIVVPFIEDARADFAPYYTSYSHGTTEKAAREYVAEELSKLGGRNARFTPGFFGNSPKRHGFLLTFEYGGVDGQIQVAGLPIKNRDTADKQAQVRVQALLNVRDWLKTAITAQVFAPGSEPLIPFLLIDGKRTVSQYISELRELPTSNPALPSGK